MDIKTAVIYRLNDLIKQKDITVNEAGKIFCMDKAGMLA